MLTVKALARSAVLRVTPAAVTSIPLASGDVIFIITKCITLEGRLEAYLF